MQRIHVRGSGQINRATTRDEEMFIQSGHDERRSGEQWRDTTSSQRGCVVERGMEERNRSSERAGL